MQTGKIILSATVIIIPLLAVIIALVLALISPEQKEDNEAEKSEST